MIVLGIPSAEFERVAVLSTAAFAAREPVVPERLRMEEAEAFFRKKGYREIGRDGTRRLLLVSPDLYDPDAMADALELRKTLAKALTKGKLLDAKGDAKTGDLLQRTLGKATGLDVRGAVAGIGVQNMIQVEVEGKTLTLGSGSTPSPSEERAMNDRVAPALSLPPGVFPGGGAGSWFAPRLVDLNFQSFARLKSVKYRNEGFFAVTEKLGELLGEYETRLEESERDLSRAALASGLDDFSANALVPGRPLIDLPEPERTKLKQQFRGQFDSDEEAEAAWGRARMKGGQRMLTLSVTHKMERSGDRMVPNRAAILIPR